MKEKMMKLTLTNLRKILRGYNKEFKIVGISTRGKEDLINEFVGKTDKIKTDFNQVNKDLDDIIKLQKKPVTNQTTTTRKSKKKLLAYEKAWAEGNFTKSQRPLIARMTDERRKEVLKELGLKKPKKR
jgi:hypothetical protein